MFLSYFETASAPSFDEESVPRRSIVSSLDSVMHICLTMTPSKLAALILTMFLWSQSARIEISLKRPSRLWCLLNSVALPAFTFNIFTATYRLVFRSMASLTLYVIEETYLKLCPRDGRINELSMQLRSMKVRKNLMNFFTLTWHTDRGRWSWGAGTGRPEFF